MMNAPDRLVRGHFSKGIYKTKKLKYDNDEY